MTDDKNRFGLIQEVDITDEMQSAYLNYAMSVIVSRALPDVRDGLKPVHRRILYAMYHDLHLTADKVYKKSARIVGEVLGKYHPHGDTAVYDAMVRMAQEFSLRYPLVDGQGNFGSIDGDNAAAMRYTEARLASISDLMLIDLEKDTVEWGPNFDNTLQEPLVLPANLPNLLINGASGIAVGMATNVPPHNLGEIVDALVYMIDRFDKIDEISVEDLMHFVKGPDFPTGGILYRFRSGKRTADEDVDAITQGYATGRARLTLQAKAHFEEMSRNRSRIVVTEMPYMTNKTNLIERIASLVRDGKLEGVTDLRDESDRTGMRLCIEMTRNVEPKDILADLFKYTPMQQTFGMSMLALVDGEPRTLSLKRMLQLFIEHRQVVIRRRSEYDLAKAKERAHIVEGLLKALDILDEVIDTIRRSQKVETARNNLMRNFGFSEVQAQAILDMQLKKLAALERRKLQDEYDELLKLIAYLEELLANPGKVLGVIRADLLATKAQFGDVRRTQIVERTGGTLTSTDLLPDQHVWVSVAADGNLQRQSVVNVDTASLKKLGKGSEVALILANTRDFLYLFDTNGRTRRLSIHEIPQDGTPKHLAELTDFSRRDDIVAAVVLPRVASDEAVGNLIMATRQGMVKRVTLTDFLKAAAADPDILRVEEKDKLGWVFFTPGDGEVMLFTASGQSIRFEEGAVRTMGLAAGGVAGIKLKKKDAVVSAALVHADGFVVTATELGFVKRTPIDEYGVQGRNGGGIVTHKTSARTGLVAGATVVAHDIAGGGVVLLTKKGVSKPVMLEEIPDLGRGTLGKSVVDIAQGDAIATMTVVRRAPGSRDDPSDDSGEDEPKAAKPKAEAKPKAAATAKPQATVKLKVEPKTPAKTESKPEVVTDVKPKTPRTAAAKPSPAAPVQQGLFGDEEAVPVKPSAKPAAKKSTTKASAAKKVDTVSSLAKSQRKKK